MLHYRIVILHSGIHLCFFSVIGDAVTVSVGEFPLQLLLLQRMLCTVVNFRVFGNSKAKATVNLGKL